MFRCACGLRITHHLRRALPPESGRGCQSRTMSHRPASTSSRGQPRTQGRRASPASHARSHQPEGTETLIVQWRPFCAAMMAGSPRRTVTTT